MVKKVVLIEKSRLDLTISELEEGETPSLREWTAEWLMSLDDQSIYEIEAYKDLANDKEYKFVLDILEDRFENYEVDDIDDITVYRLKVSSRSNTFESTLYIVSLE